MLDTLVQLDSLCAQWPRSKVKAHGRRMTSLKAKSLG